MSNDTNGTTPDLRRLQRKTLPLKPCLDRLPPHSSEAEQGVLGCIMLAPMTCFDDCGARLSVDDFYDLRHQSIYKAMSSLRSNNINIDILSLYQQLKADESSESIGGLAYLNQLEDATPSAANLSYYLDIVLEKATLRRLISVSTEFIGRAYEARDVAGLLDAFEIAALAIRPGRRQTSDIKSLINHAIDKIEYRVNNPDKLSGMETSLIDLDAMTSGVHSGEMVVIAGFPSTGKSALAMNIAVHNALKGVPAAIFTAEMTPTAIALRSLCSSARSNAKRIYEGDVPRLTVAAGKISHAPLHIESASGLTIGQLQAIARSLRQKHGVKIFVVDYIQLLSGVGDNREQQISSISKGCKAMAMENDAAVLALSQLTDDGKLRESRAIGQDADTVWKLENDGEWQPLIQPIKLNIEKCRDGETGRVDLTFFKQWTLFQDRAKVESEDVP